jgi:RimJ/RimL family protein N-acetyltransferase
MLVHHEAELIIRKAESADAGRMVTYLNTVGGESDNLLFGADGFPLNADQEAQWIADVNGSPTSALLAGFVREQIVCVGSLTAPRRERIAHQGEIALSVLKAYWGRGIGTRMMQELIAFARGTGKLEVLHLGVRDDNAPALALYEKAGFIRIGVYPRFFKINGAYYDEVLMNLYL